MKKVPAHRASGCLFCLVLNRLGNVGRSRTEHFGCSTRRPLMMQRWSIVAAPQDKETHRRFPNIYHPTGNLISHMGEKNVEMGKQQKPNCHRPRLPPPFPLDGTNLPCPSISTHPPRPSPTTSFFCRLPPSRLFRFDPHPIVETLSSPSPPHQPLVTACFFALTVQPGILQLTSKPQVNGVAHIVTLIIFALSTTTRRNKQGKAKKA